MITLTWQSLTASVGIIGAAIILAGYLKKVFGFFDKPGKQDEEIKNIKVEQELLTNGMLACLKGLVELGCDGPVKEQISAIEQHQIRKAHM